jgi:hypothetical protein
MMMACISGNFPENPSSSLYFFLPSNQDHPLHQSKTIIISEHEVHLILPNMAFAHVKKNQREFDTRLAAHSESNKPWQFGGSRA